MVSIVLAFLYCIFFLASWCAIKREWTSGFDLQIAPGLDPQSHPNWAHALPPHDRHPSLVVLVERDSFLPSDFPPYPVLVFLGQTTATPHGLDRVLDVSELVG